MRLGPSELTVAQVINGASSQVVLDKTGPSLLSFAIWQSKNLIWFDTLIYPAYLAGASAILLLLHIILLSKPSRRLHARLFRSSSPEFEESSEEAPPVLPVGFVAEVKEHIATHGGLTIYLHMVLKFIGCLALLGLSITSLILYEIRNSDDKVHSLKSGKHHKNKHHSRALSTNEWLQAAMCMTYLYASLLGLISLTASPRWSRLVSRHLSFLLLFSFGVYAYRDLFPLTTFVMIPKDLSEGWILPAKVAILTLIAIVIPLIAPRQYIPVDPKEPASEANPEQTASLLSLGLYSFLDPVVFLAYRIPHLSYNQLPPLADYDHSKYMTKRAFQHLDPFSGSKKRHIFFGLMRVFRLEYTILSILIVIQVLVGFASPLGINRLLNYLETNGKDAVVKPWFWISWLFIGPTIGSICFQRYIFIATRNLVRTEGIITQLIFEHSLRIRMKAETADTVPAAIEDATAPSSPDNETVGDESSRRERNSTLVDETLHSPGGSGDETVHSSSASISSTSTAKGKARAKVKGDVDPVAKKDGYPTADNLVGKINNLVTTDLGNITDARDFLLVFIYIPLQITLCIVFLYQVLGWSAFVGLAVMLVLFPIPGLIARKVQVVQVERMKKTDSRVQTVSETMNVLRMIKLFGWEAKMNDKVKVKREDELTWVWKRKIMDLLNNCLNFFIPVVTMVATYTTYTVIMKQELNASKVFSSMSVFDMLRDQLHMVFYTITQVVQGKVSLDRVNDFLHNTELLDSFSEKEETAIELLQSNKDEETIGFRNATFAWSSVTDDGTLTPSKRRFNLRIEELIFKRGSINLIVGPTGSGKTSLLMALLGEMHFIPSGPDSWYNLPRGGGIAYAAQESWVQNETIRENIVFGAEFDEKRYKKVIYQCGLERDLDLFEAGDKTEVGEKGLTLSGGQKARITLARAIYSSAEIILLDDVLAALDVHTSKWIIEKCFKGDLIKGRTILLVTHNVVLASPIADFVVSLGLNGRVLSQGSDLSIALARDKRLASEVKKEKQVVDKADDEVDMPATEEKKADGKLVVAEEIAEGHISWPALKLYLSGLGGGHTSLFFFVFIGGLLLVEFSFTIQVWYLGYWASQYEHHDASEVIVSFYLTVYCSLLLLGLFIYSVVSILYMLGSLRASRKIHQQLVESILGTTLRWLDTTPVSRVITRCTQDIRAVDGPIAQGLSWLVELTTSMTVKFAAVVLLTPIFLFPGIFIAVLGAYCGQIYIKAQLSVKREMSNAKSPVLGHFGAAIAGLTSIRAYGAQQAFKAESLVRIDRYTRAARTFYNLNRWICIRIDGLGAAFAAGLATYLVYGRSSATSSNTGFSLNMAVGFASMILWWVRILNDFEVQGNSLERIQGYVTIEQEPKPTEGGKPPAAWPTSGEIRVENLSARYSQDGPKVLHDLSFHIKSGERVGIVGRTGSGKSSLTLSLLRCIFTEGNVYFDGIPTSSINLDDLRSNVTIIPQVPELLSGTLRTNLDPFSQYDDATLNDALRAAGLFSLQSEGDEGRITLDSAISSGGGNLSVGQRQILALARAIVRGSKLLILDEATSAIDYKTDSVIQSSLRNELGGDVTLITVAHRLQTIMDADKIMVLDAGRVVEFDSPSALLKNEKGMLRALVDESGDKEILEAMAEGKTV